jgi:hypothetical protein
VSQAEFDEWVETTVAEGVGAANRMLTQRLRARGLLAAIDHEDSLAAPLAHAPAY